MRANRKSTPTTDMLVRVDNYALRESGRGDTSSTMIRSLPIAALITLTLCLSLVRLLRDNDFFLLIWWPPRGWAVLISHSYAKRKAACHCHVIVMSFLLQTQRPEAAEPSL